MGAVGPGTGSAAEGVGSRTETLERYSCNSDGTRSSPLRSAERPSLDGRVIVITGAGTGIGQAAAVEAACRGARLILVGRRAEPLSATAGHCRDLGAEAALVEGDLARAEIPGQIVGLAMRKYGRIDGIVNNAGIARFAALEDCLDADVRSMFEVNFLAPLRLIREAIGPLRAARGSVVNVSSIGGTVATPHRAAYGAIKAALNHLTRSLARELAPDVRVNAVLPGPILTPMWDDLLLDGAETDRLRSEMIRTTPAGRLGRPEDVAPWICELLAERSAWATGSLMTIDGGRSS